MTMTQVIHVECQSHRDYFIATSKELPGLFVASKDFKEVMDDVPECIEILFKHNYGAEVTVKKASSLQPRPAGEIIYTAECVAA